jgi:hypothetical protein
LIIDPSKQSYNTRTIDVNCKLFFRALNNNSTLDLNSIENDFVNKNSKEIKSLRKNISGDKAARLISQSQFFNMTLAII